MNIVLLEPGEQAFAASDTRARHVREVLRRDVGDTFDAGVVDGAMGKATITGLDPLTFTFVATHEPPPLPDVTLVVGLPRPATARDVLRDATTLGVRAIHFVTTERTNASYAESRLWTSGEARALLVAGAAQAFDTRLPAITHGRPLREVLGVGVALDNYEAPAHLARWVRPVGPVTVYIGPERGWGPADRAAIRAAGIPLFHLGTRVLRVETAVVAALTLVNAP